MKIPRLEISVGKLKKEYKRLILLAPYFLKSILCNPKEYGTLEEIEKFAETITRQEHGNFLRVFTFWPHSPYAKFLYSPFKQRPNGKYRLNKINPQWRDWFLWVSDIFISRGWTIAYTLCEHSQLRNRIDCWKSHPFYKQNNTRFAVPELGKTPSGKAKKYHTHHDNKSAFGHCFDWDRSGEGSKFCEQYGYCKEEDMPPWAKDDMNMNRAMRESLLFFWHYVLDMLKGEFGNNFFIDHNEWPRGISFHNMMADIYKGYGIGKNRRMTSFLYDDWYNSKKSVFKKYHGQVHGIHWQEDIQGKLYTLPTEHKFMFSQDGGRWGSHGYNYKRLREAIKYSLDEGLGYEINNDFWPDEDPVVDLRAGREMRKAFEQWREEHD